MQKRVNSNIIRTSKRINWASIILVILFFYSCANPRKFVYFKTLIKDTTIDAFVSQKLETKIQKSDILSISVSSLSTEMDEKFNTAAKLVSDNTNSSFLNSNFGFLVGQDGQINLHLLGNYKVEGLTRKELSKNLERDLQPFMKDPIVTVQYLNKKVTIIGEVSTPKVIYMNTEEMTLIDAIVNCGDLKENAIASDIMIIRDSLNHKIIKHINLEDHSLFSSEWYYVKPDDIVYIKRDISETDKEEKRRTLQTTISLVASMTSLLVIILNILIK